MLNTLIYATLAQAFLYAGASSVAATLWRIGDEGAAEFAARFYSRLSGMAAPEALAAAQRELIRDKRFGNPYYWAAYQIGGADEFVNSPQKGTSVSPPHLKGTFLSLHREDYATLAQAFLYAGARAVASTLWRIDDRTNAGGRPYYINRNHTLVNRRGNDVFFDLPIIEG